MTEIVLDYEIFCTCTISVLYRLCSDFILKIVLVLYNLFLKIVQIIYRICNVINLYINFIITELHKYIKSNDSKHKCSDKMPSIYLICGEFKGYFRLLNCFLIYN